MGGPALEHLRQLETRLRARRLYGAPNDSLSVRIVGCDALLYLSAREAEPRRVSLESARCSGADPSRLHAKIYHSRHDAGAILIGETPWTSAVAAIGRAVPTLFDEQARHIGRMHAPVGRDPLDHVIVALHYGGNVAIRSTERVCLGPTPGRVALNADLFEKCAKAFVIAHATGSDLRGLPFWARAMWWRRLRRDQKRAAKDHDAGRMPESMDAY